MFKENDDPDDEKGTDSLDCGEGIEQLVQALRRKVKRNEAELKQNRQRIEALEKRHANGEGNGGGSHPTDWNKGDYRDDNVLRAATVGTVYSFTELVDLYLVETDIKDEGKIRNRVEPLTQSEFFESTASTGRWKRVRGTNEVGGNE